MRGGTGTAQHEFDRVPQMLTGTIRQRTERFAVLLLQLTDEAAVLVGRVEGRLAKTEALWK